MTKSTQNTRFMCVSRNILSIYNIMETPPKPIDGLIGITHNVQTASGYLVNAAERLGELIDCLEYGGHMLEKTGEIWNYTNDQIWKRLQQDDKWYYFIERVGRQRQSYSNIEKRVVNYGC